MLFFQEQKKNTSWNFSVFGLHNFLMGKGMAIK